MSEPGWTVVELVDEVTTMDDRLVVETVATVEREVNGQREGSEWRLEWIGNVRPQAVRCLRRAKEEGLVVLLPEEVEAGLRGTSRLAMKELARGSEGSEGSEGSDRSGQIRTDRDTTGDRCGPGGDDDQNDDLDDDLEDEQDDDLELINADDLLNVVRAEIRQAIAAHELRVAIASGVLGLLLLAGTWHAIWLPPV